MIYPADFESKIGFDSIRTCISELCATRLGKEEVVEMKFSADFDIVNTRLRLVDEMMRILTSDAPFPDGRMHDVIPALSRIKAQGSFMPAQELSQLCITLESMVEIKDYFSTSESEEESTMSVPYLRKEFSDMESFPYLIKEIRNKINKYGEVKDTASDTLYDIRQAIRSASGSMQRAMRKVIDVAVRNGVVDKDATPSLRDGRLVIPVSAGNKYALNGIIHDESSTGKTVFIEPAEVVEAGNKIRQLEMDERREIAAILTAIANLIRPDINNIISGCRKIGKLDFIKAKARYAISLDAQMPHLSKEDELEWYHAEHPVLKISLRQQNREVVPLNITLTQEKRILVISGPNAGGKSVCLKTVAIVQYMMQCGVMPTLHYNSHMGIFKKLFIDIGDEQSLENDLSTYSSHLTNMKFFLKYADSHTIILADEMGSGTEPQIGGAMAQAILVELGKRKCRGVVTTHYQNLKTFAETAPGFVNGAMTYDRQHLMPTFELSIGTPGSSFAIDIARKIGLPNEVIEDAKEIAGSDYVNLDKYISDIARDRRYWINKRQQIKEKENKLDSLLSTYEEHAGDLKAQRKAILNDARREAKEIVSGANARIERTILEIRKAQAEKERTKEIRKELSEYAGGLDTNSISDQTPEVLKPLKHKSRKHSQPKVEKPSANPSAPKPLQVGDFVKLEDGGTVGEILSISGKKAEVAFGLMRTTVALDRLNRTSRPKKSALEQTSGISSSALEESRKRQLDFKTDIDVRGMRADEALQAVTYFIDDAVQFSASRVRILHGTGHGILKTLIRQWLGANSAVRHFEDEDVRYGGAGITVVDLH